MEQLSINITSKSNTKVIASSAYDFRIELIIDLGKDDAKEVISISKDLDSIFENNMLMSMENISKYYRSIAAAPRSD